MDRLAKPENLTIAHSKPEKALVDLGLKKVSLMMLLKKKAWAFLYKYLIVFQSYLKFVMYR